MSSKKRDQRKARERAAHQTHRQTSTASDPFGFAGTKPLPSQREIVERVLLEGIYAHDAGRRAEVDRSIRSLGERASALTVVFDVLQSEVVAVWRRGWQPGELHRSLKRELTIEHAALVGYAMAAQMLTYAPATVDDRWQEQLKAIRARVIWHSDKLPLDMLGGYTGRLTAGVAAQVIEAIWHLRRLPPLPFTGPLPGEARPGSPRPSAAADQKMLDKVRALLAKAESTTFPEEAEAYTAKAQELMARHSIDVALLMARTGGRDEPGVRRISIDSPYEAPKTLLLQAVSEANGCRSVWSQYFGFCTVAGFPGDLDSVELLFTSLLVQAVAAMTQSGPKQDRYGRNNTRSFRQSFLTAYAQRIGERLQGATETAVNETIEDVGADALLPVLKARSDEVTEKFQELFPQLQTHSIAVSNREGWTQGRAAADRADLHGRRAVPK
ncbi:DUF2786 domain-containing protein [Hamadaea sp.]|uniref:DUF2786 domain-containing protein n=1 Tax=Hamadaea sp. TaxID=2024425 RepID=UPI0025BA3CAC|nr:DUF2786 domain-containing protein [Hamadaea sp.]